MFVTEWECPVFDEEVPTTGMLQPRCAAWRVLPPVSRYECARE